jgi:hypothetical protein
MLKQEQKEKAKQIWLDSPADLLASIYAVYEAALTEGAAQGPVQVTLQEVWKIKPWGSLEQLRDNINTVLAERLPQPTVAPENPAQGPVERVKVELYPSESGDDFAVWLDGKSILTVVNKREWCEGYAARVRTELAAERKEAGNE